MNILKNNTIFPEYMKIELCDELVKKINDIVGQYKNNIKEAVVYSLTEKTTMKSDRRVSHKTSFHSEELTKIINDHICPLIYSMLREYYPDAQYDIMIGAQSFDYIKYDNGGYFDKHKDFVRVNSSMQKQYSMLIGLTDKTYLNETGNTVLWLDNPNNDKDPKKQLDSCIPCRINCYTKGKSLLFRSDIVHSGEEFYNWYNAKELFMLTINISGMSKQSDWLKDTNSKIIMFDNIETIPSDTNIIPFQIIIAKGDYNHKTFSDIYTKYLNLQDNFKPDNSNILERINIILADIYKKTKDKLNKRGREEHISMEVLESKSDLKSIESIYNNNNNNIYNYNYNINIDYDSVLIDINNYVKNYINETSSNIQITHMEKVNNTWEESTCNDDGDEYDDITYLNCTIDIKFCFIKI